MSELQKCAVWDLFSTTEIEKYINDGLFKNEDDWFKMTALAQEVLSHKCTPRCMRKVELEDGTYVLRCRKIHSVLGKTKPMEDEYIPFNYDYSQACLNIWKSAVFGNVPMMMTQWDVERFTMTFLCQSGTWAAFTRAQNATCPL